MEATDEGVGYQNSPLHNGWSKWQTSQRRRPADDPFFDEGTLACNMNYSKWIVGDESDDDDDDFHPTSTLIFESFCCQERGCKKVFESVASYEFHYNSEHRYVCSTCRRMFPNNHLLDVHVLEWHDAMFELQALRSPMHRCLIEACNVMFTSAKHRKNHMIKVHKYPSNFRFDRPKKNSVITPKFVSAKCETLIKEPEPGERMETGEVVCCSENSSTDANSSRSANSTSLTRVLTETSRVTAENLPATMSESNYKYSYKVPKTICFGSASQRGFCRPKREKSKHHWHQLERPDADTHVDIENVDMNELLQAMDS